MPQGVVKWFDIKKKYGFIVADDSGKDVFVHLEKLTEAGIFGISEGDRVGYNTAPASKGRVQAINVFIISKNNKLKKNKAKKQKSLIKPKKKIIPKTTIRTEQSIMPQIKEGLFLLLKNGLKGYVFDIDRNTFKLLLSSPDGKKTKILKYNYMGWLVNKKGRAWDSPYSVNKTTKAHSALKKVATKYIAQKGVKRSLYSFEEEVTYLTKKGLLGASNENGSYISDTICAWEIITK